MNRQVIIVTGAAGFLGSAITADLSRDYRVVAIDRRKPTGDLLHCAPHASWQQVDIADASGLGLAFDRTKDVFGRIDSVVHFAAFYHFGTDWHREYERTNLEGTSNVLRCAIRSGARRVMFASSVAAMLPPPPGGMLTEKTPAADYIPYAKSKSLGEKMVREAADRLAGIALRIGGAFSDWSELPPLSSLIKLWGGRSPLSRLMVGRGTTGIPYIHRDDVVRMVRVCIDRRDGLDPFEVFLASQHGAILHRDLLSVIHGAGAEGATSKPIFVQPRIAKIGLCLRRAVGRLTRNAPYERPWMLQYVDRPWVTDTTYTRHKLGWSCTEGMGVLDRLPTILENFRRRRPTWEHRNRLRNSGQYAYYDHERRK